MSNSQSKISLEQFRQVFVRSGGGDIFKGASDQKYVDAINSSSEMLRFRREVLNGSLNGIFRVLDGPVPIPNGQGTANGVTEFGRTKVETSVKLNGDLSLLRTLGTIENEFSNIEFANTYNFYWGENKDSLNANLGTFASENPPNYVGSIRYRTEIRIADEVLSDVRMVRVLLEGAVNDPSAFAQIIATEDRRLPYLRDAIAIVNNPQFTREEQDKKLYALVDAAFRKPGSLLHEIYVLQEVNRQITASGLLIADPAKARAFILAAINRYDIQDGQPTFFSFMFDDVEGAHLQFDSLINSGSMQGFLGDGTLFVAELTQAADGSLVGNALDPAGNALFNVIIGAPDETGNRILQRQLPNGAIETFAFDENRNFTSKLITGTSNGLPYERTIYADGRIAEALFNATGTRIGTEVTQVIGIDQIVRRLDATGVLQSTITTTPDDVGNVTRTTDLPSGRSVVELLQPANPTDLLGPKVLVSRTELYQEANGTVDVTERYNASNELQSIERRSTVVLDNGDTGQQVVTFDALTRQQVSTVLGGNGAVISTTTTQTLTPADNARLNDLVSGLGGLNGAYSQWIAGNKVEGAILLGGASVNVAIALGGESVRQSLGGVNSLFGGLGQLINLDQVFSRSGNEFGKLSATASALNFANNNINRLIESGANGTGAFSAPLSSVLNGSGNGLASATSIADIGVLPVLNLVNGIRNKDPFATISGIIGIVNPALLTSGPAGWLLAGLSILYNATQEPPLGWGEGKFTLSPDPSQPGQLRVSITGESFGVTQVQNTLEGFTQTVDGVPRYNPGLRDYLYRIVNQTGLGAQQGDITQTENRQNDITAPVQLDPTAKLGIIAQRLPSLNFMEARGSEGPGFRITEINPLTGQQVRANLRWDDNWAAYNAQFENNAEQVSLMPALVRAAMARGAIAPMWEVRTAQMQQQYNDPLAGLAEEERAAKLGLSAQLDGAGKALNVTFRPVVIDLNLDGQISRLANNDTNAVFDWDDSGFDKQVDWVAGGDGFLALDRNLDGQIDSARELFSNSKVVADGQGLRSMVWVDANGDGVINAADPVFNELKIWQDINGDGKSSNDELNGLGHHGITEIEYGANRITRNSQLQNVGDGQMTGAETGGQRVVRNGIQIETENGTVRLHISNLGPTQQTQNNGQGMSAAVDFQEVDEDTANLSFTLAELLSNDEGFNGSTTGIEFVSVGAQQNLTATWNEATQAVDITLQKDFAGRASFLYTLRAPNGSTIEVPVVLNVNAVDDPVDLVINWDDGKNVYGFNVLVRTTPDQMNGDNGPTLGTTTYAPGDGTPIYNIFTTIGGRRVSTAVDVDELGNTTTQTTISDTFEDIGVTMEAAATYLGWDLSSFSPDPQNPLGGVLREVALNGATWQIYTTGPQYVHDTPLYVEKPRSGVLIAKDPDNLDRRYEYVLTALTNSNPDSISLDPTTGRFEYRPSRYVGQSPDGVDINGNVGYDKTTGTDWGAIYIRSESVLNERDNYDYFAVGLNYIDPDGTRGSLKPVDDTVDVPHYGQKVVNVRSGAKKPIAIDLDGDGFHFTDVDDSNVFYSVNETGWRRRIAWNNPNDGLIAFDKNSDGKIDRFDEISFVSYVEGAATDLEGLRAFDTNNDGVFNQADAQWEKFGVWKDANSNGITEQGEFIGLNAMGITSVQLTSDQQFQVVDGQTVHGTATATLTDGTTLSIADVSLNWKNQTRVINADGSSQIIDLPNFAQGQEFSGTYAADISFGNEGSDVHRLGNGDNNVLDDMGDDEVHTGSGKDLIFTGAGNDQILSGGGDDNVWSGAGNDVVFADDENGAGNDFIMSGDGNDIIFGGSGSDFMALGTGNDVASGDAGDDKIFGESGSDALIGGDGADELYADIGNDLLDGGDGNDLLDGGLGNDQMEGGLGDDKYIVDSRDDAVVEGLSAGLDTIYSSINYTLSANLENLTLTGDAAILAIGNSANNILIGNNAANDIGGFDGDDVIDGGAGVDRLYGGKGNDVFYVDDKDDWVIEDGLSGVDTVKSSASEFTLSLYVENLELIGNAPINATGSAYANTLTGNTNNNRIDGGGGADTMFGGKGNDTYVVDLVTDTVTEFENEGIDRIESTVDWTLADHTEELKLSGAAQFGYGNNTDNFISGTETNFHGEFVNEFTLSGVELHGFSGNDTLIGSNFGDRLYGGEGDDYLDASHNGSRWDPLNLDYSGDESYDYLFGGLGDDTYVVDIHNGLDVISENANEGIDTVIATSLWGWSLTEHFENLVLRDFAYIATGNASANLIIVESGLDSTVYADAGNDTVIGGAGNDYIYGQSGNDQLYGGSGNDNITDVEGNNFIDGGDGDDSINARASTVRGGRGDDVFTPGPYDILSESGNTYLFDLGDGNDRIFEQDFWGVWDPNADVTQNEIDKIAFGIGITPDMIKFERTEFDFIFRVNGADSITLQQWFMFTSSSRIERVTFQDGTVWDNFFLQSKVPELWVDPNQALTLDSGGNLVAGSSTFDGWSGADRLDGAIGNDNIYSEAGDDIVFGGPGDDYLFDDGGNDQLFGGDGNDTLRDSLGNDQITGGAGDDNIIDISGTNVIDGGSGNDTISAIGTITGGVGDDIHLSPSTYGLPQNLIGSGRDIQFGIGDGNDLVDNYSVSGFRNALVFKSGINPTDVIFSNHENGSDLVIRFVSSPSDSITWKFGIGGFAAMTEAGATPPIDEIIFADGTRWNAAEISNRVLGNQLPLLKIALQDQEAISTRLFEYVIATDSFLDPDPITPLTYTAQLESGASLPSWLTFNPTTLSFTGTPVSGLAEALLIKVTATDSAGASVSDTFEIDVANRIVGTTVNNVLNGTANRDYIEGLEGNDTLDGKLGRDTLVGGLGNDTYIVDDTGDAVVEGFSEGTDHVKSSTNFVLTSNVENLTLTGNDAYFGEGNELANAITGTALGNILVGRAGNDRLLGLLGDDTLYGDEGNDTLDGGVGADTLIGGVGNDTYVVDSSSDLLIEEIDAGTDAVSASIDFVLASHFENLTLVGAATTGTGNDQANTLIGNTLDNTLYGLDGNDKLYGKGGSNTLVGGLGDDYYELSSSSDFVIENIDEGTDHMRIAQSGTLAENFETLSYSVTGDVDGVGNDLNNTLYGTAGVNHLIGLGGNDRFIAGASNDVMEGGQGNDIYDGNEVGDNIIELNDAGVDSVNAYVTYTLHANVETVVLRGTLAIDAYGNQLANTMTGNTADNQLYGFGGNDTINGGTANDLLVGGLGNDKSSGAAGIDLLFGDEGLDNLNGGDDNDLIVGGTDIDTLFGGNSNDFVVGGIGNDVIDLGTGIDVFAFNRGDGNDIIKMGLDQTDVLSLSGMQLADLTLSKSGSNLIVGTGNGESLTLQSWYSATTRRNINQLQLFTATIGGDFDSASANPLYNNKVVRFDFLAIVSAFGAARGTATTFSNWSMNGTLNTAFIAGSNSEAIGGTVAWSAALGGLQSSDAQSIRPDLVSLSLVPSAANLSWTTPVVTSPFSGAVATSSSWNMVNDAYFGSVTTVSQTELINGLSLPLDLSALWQSAIPALPSGPFLSQPSAVPSERLNSLERMFG